MVLNELEHKMKERLKHQDAITGDVHAPTSWEQDPNWGNDGLLGVQSAKWGEFLGRAVSELTLSSPPHLMTVMYASDGSQIDKPRCIQP